MAGAERPLSFFAPLFMRFPPFMRFPLFMRFPRSPPFTRLFALLVLLLQRRHDIRIR